LHIRYIEGRKVNRKTVSGIMVTLLLTGILTLAINIQTAKAEPTTWYVDDDGGADFTRIQDAINAASPGDTIYVYNGTYYEHIYIFISLTLIGENRYATIIDGSGYGTTVGISYTKGVKLTGFTIRNAETGINLYRSSNNTIASNIITNSTLGHPLYWGGGIYLEISSNNTIADNTISNTTEAGVHAQRYSYHNTIVGNVISRNTEIEIEDSSGIFLDEDTYENTVLDNVISKSHRGIYAAQSSYNNTIIGNTISSLTIYECGINIWGPNNRILGNTITNAGYVGIQLNSISSDGGYGVPNACANNVVSGNIISNSTFGINLILIAFSNTITGNNVSNNGIGIMFGDSNNHTVTNNLVSNNDYGIALFSSDNTKVYHNNFINNTQQVPLSQSFNTAWDDGYPSGGNYWSGQYHGDCADHYSGPSQDIPGSDGIVDTSYPISADNQDNYPLMEPWTPFPPIPTTIDELKTEIEELGFEGEIDNQGIVQSLIAKLNVAQKLVDGGKMDQAKNILNAFINEVQAQSGKHITPEAAEILVESAEYIISHL